MNTVEGPDILTLDDDLLWHLEMVIGYILNIVNVLIIIGRFYRAHHFPLVFQWELLLL